jgi:hypothetical protein
MEVRCIPWQDNHCTGQMRLQSIGVEFVAKADIEDARYDGVDPVLGVAMRHQLYASGYLDSDQVGTGLRWLAHNDG